MTGPETAGLPRVHDRGSTTARASPAARSGQRSAFSSGCVAVHLGTSFVLHARASRNTCGEITAQGVNHYTRQRCYVLLTGGKISGLVVQENAAWTHRTGTTIGKVIERWPVERYIWLILEDGPREYDTTTRVIELAGEARVCLPHFIEDFRREEGSHCCRSPTPVHQGVRRLPPDRREFPDDRGDRPHGPALRHGHVGFLLPGPGHPRSGLQSGGRLRIPCVSDRKDAGGPGKNHRRDRTRRGARVRGHQLHAGGRAGREQIARARGPRGGGPQVLQPPHARGDQPRGQRPPFGSAVRPHGDGCGQPGERRHSRQHGTSNRGRHVRCCLALRGAGRPAERGAGASRPGAGRVRAGHGAPRREHGRPGPAEIDLRRARGGFRVLSGRGPAPPPDAVPARGDRHPGHPARRAPVDQPDRVPGHDPAGKERPADCHGFRGHPEGGLLLRRAPASRSGTRPSGSSSWRRVGTGAYPRPGVLWPWPPPSRSGCRNSPRPANPPICTARVTPHRKSWPFWINRDRIDASRSSKPRRQAFARHHPGRHELLRLRRPDLRRHARQKTLHGGRTLSSGIRGGLRRETVQLRLGRTGYDLAETVRGRGCPSLPGT